jgi:hypothetical protein
MLSLVSDEVFFSPPEQLLLVPCLFSNFLFRRQTALSGQTPHAKTPGKDNAN